MHANAKKSEISDILADSKTLLSKHGYPRSPHYHTRLSYFVFLSSRLRNLIMRDGCREGAIADKRENRAWV